MRRLAASVSLALLAACGGSTAPQSPPAPATPVNVSATAAGLGVTVSWSASAAATSYVVSRGSAAAGPFAAVGAPVTTTYSDSGLAAGTTYFYQVAAKNSGGASAASAAVSATTAPPAPASLGATGGAGKISLSWPAAAGAAGYLVLRGTAAGAESPTAIATPSGTSYDDTGVAAGTTYFYVVAAQNGAGQGPSSPEASAATAPAIPAAPSSLLATATGGASIALSWPAVTGATSYKVFRGGSAGGEGSTPIATPSTNSFTDTGLAGATSYFYLVRASNVSGDSPASPEASAVTAPAAPANVVATGGAQSVALSWDASTGATTYLVYRGTSAGGESGTPIATQSGTALTDSGLADGTTYFYTVKAQGASGTSAPSTEKSAITLPAAPTLNSAQAGDTAVTLSWSAVAGATGYQTGVSTTSGSGYTFQAATTNTTTTVTGLIDGTKYYFVVQALDASGVGPASNQLFATPTAGLPAAPVLSGSVGTNQVTLSWTTVAGVTGYKLFRSGTSGTGYTQLFPATGTTTATTDTDTGLVNGTTYYYVVRSHNAAGDSVDSNEQALTPAPAVVAPVISALAGNGKVTLSWGTVAGATTYEIARALSPGGESFASPASTASTTYVDASAPNGIPYYYEVRARNAAGPGPKSNEVAATAAVELCVASDKPYVFAIDAAASGEQNARRTFGGSTMLFAPTGVAADAADGELFVANENSASITVHALGASGDAPPLRLIAGSATTLHNPQAVAVDAGLGDLFVFDGTANASSDGTILVFSRTANGNVAPIITIQLPTFTCNIPPSGPVRGAIAVNPGVEFFFSCGGAPDRYALPGLSNTSTPTYQVAFSGVSQNIASLAYNAAASRLYAGTRTASGNANLLILDPAPAATNNPVLRIASTSITNVVGLATDGTQILATEPFNSVFFFNISSASTSNTAITPSRSVSINSGLGESPAGATWDSGALKFWVAETSYGGLLPIAQTASSVGNSITAPFFLQLLTPGSLTADRVHDLLWVANADNFTGTRSQVDGFPLTTSVHASALSKVIATPSSPSPFTGLGQVFVNPTQSELYVADPGANADVTSWSTATPGAAPLHPAITGLPTPYGLAFDGAQLLVGVGTSATDSAIKFFTRNSDGTFTPAGSDLTGAPLNNPGFIWEGSTSASPAGEILVVNNADNSLLAYPRSGGGAPRQLKPALAAGESIGSAIEDAAGNIYVAIGAVATQGTAANPPRFHIDVYAAGASGFPASAPRSITVRGTAGTAAGLAFCN